MTDYPKRFDDPDVTRTRDGGEPPSPLLQPLPATIGRYRVLGKLGEGGMGVVYEAEQDNPRRRVAVKVVRAGHAVDDQHVRESAKLAAEFQERMGDAASAKAWRAKQGG
jgi:serine/threonine protein kinase